MKTKQKDKLCWACGESMEQSKNQVGYAYVHKECEKNVGEGKHIKRPSKD